MLKEDNKEAQMGNIRKAEIDERFLKLQKLLGMKHDPIPYLEIYRCSESNNIAGIAKIVKTQMRVDAKLQLLYHDRAAQKNSAPLWVDIPFSMPLRGSKDFADLLIPLHIRRPIFEEMNIAARTQSLAHEIMHVLLASVHSPFTRDEMAVDVAIIIFGYGIYYAANRSAMPSGKFSQPGFELFQSLFGDERISTFGYLTLEEALYVHSLC